VAATGFQDRFGSNVAHAEEIAGEVERLRRSSGWRQVAIVAHSMGGLALRHYLVRMGGDGHVHTAIFVGTPHRGTWAAWLAWGGGGREMRPGSSFLKALATSPIPSSVRCICIRTPIDARVIPGSSAVLDGTECHTVRLPTHAGMLRHPPTLHLVTRLLCGAAAPGSMG
jgi:triacylglycerol esterase/lipase EstA (alpha/beta hydrolase family)